MEAGDIMNRDVIMVTQEMTLEEAVNLLFHYRIHPAKTRRRKG